MCSSDLFPSHDNVELKEIGSVDSYMKRAYKEYTMDDSDDYDEDE